MAPLNCALERRSSKALFKGALQRRLMPFDVILRHLYVISFVFLCLLPFACVLSLTFLRLLSFDGFLSFSILYLLYLATVYHQQTVQSKSKMQKMSSEVSLLSLFSNVDISIHICCFLDSVIDITRLSLLSRPWVELLLKQTAMLPPRQNHPLLPALLPNIFGDKHGDNQSECKESLISRLYLEFVGNRGNCGINCGIGIGSTTIAIESTAAMGRVKGGEEGHEVR